MFQRHTHASLIRRRIFVEGIRMIAEMSSIRINAGPWSRESVRILKGTPRTTGVSTEKKAIRIKVHLRLKDGLNLIKAGCESVLQRAPFIVTKTTQRDDNQIRGLCRLDVTHQINIP